MIFVRMDQGFAAKFIYKSPQVVNKSNYLFCKQINTKNLILVWIEKKVQKFCGLL